MRLKRESSLSSVRATDWLSCFEHIVAAVLGCEGSAPPPLPAYSLCPGGKEGKAPALTMLSLFLFSPVGICSSSLT